MKIENILEQIEIAVDALQALRTQTVAFDRQRAEQDGRAGPRPVLFTLGREASAGCPRKPPSKPPTRKPPKSASGRAFTAPGMESSVNIHPDKAYEVTSRLRNFTMRVEQTTGETVTGRCYPGGYRGTIPKAAIHGASDPAGPPAIFKFKEIALNTIGGLACVAYFGAAMYCFGALVA